MRKHIDTIRDAALEGVVSVQASAMSGASVARRHPSGVLAGAVLGSLGLTSTAYAAGGCGNGAADALVDFIDGAAKFLLYVGGALALLAMAAGAVMVVSGTGSWPSKGFKVLKNAAIGLGILVGIQLISFIVVEFVGGAGGNKVDANCVTGGQRS